MQKQITREVQVYTYTMVKMEEVAGDFKVVDSFEINVLGKLGQRKLDTYMRENHPNKIGYVCGSFKQSSVKYTMSLEEFIKNAKII